MTFKEKEFHAVVLGALLHDIGKFVQRAQENPKSQDHSHWGENWFQDNLAEKLTPVFSEREKEIIRSAISNHHYHVDYISLADAISAGMDRTAIDLEKEEKGDPFTDRLISIFSKIGIKSKPEVEKYSRIVPLGSKNLEEIFPIEQKKCYPEEYSELLKKFNDEIKITNFGNISTENLLNFFFFLLWKYCWCIPSAAYEDEPDIPLFDHLKTTAAIAGCLYIYHQENPKINLDVSKNLLCLIGGDISGIQSFIFDVLTQQGKIAKRLRARSFYVQLISEIAAHKVLHSYKLPFCNLIFSAGGNFYILAPNLKESSILIDNLQKEFDKWILSQMNAELSISLAIKEISGKGLIDFSNSLEELKFELNEKKNKPLFAALTEKGRWLPQEFIRPEVIEGDEKACNGCHKYPIAEITPEGEAYCIRCFRDIQVGKLLPKSNYLAFYKNKLQGFEVLDYSFKLAEGKDIPIILKENPYLLLSLNETKVGLPIIGFKYFANHIPTKNDIPSAMVEEGQPVTLEDIAKESNGDKLIAYIKGDVDNMGLIIREGFKNTKMTVSRFATFSRLLETFFAGYLQTKMKGNYKEIYTVFSGGDDFFIIGPWDKIINKFAKEIRSEFSRFCGDNSDLTFSAGVFLAKSHEPVSYCSEMVEENLKKSKRKEGKDKITLFNQTVSWNELGKILNEANRIIDWLKSQPPIITRAFAHNLRKYGEMAYESQIFDPSQEVKPKFLRFIPLLVYDAKRNLTKREQKEAINWVEEFVPSIEKPYGGENLKFLRTIMDYVLTYTRS